MVGAVRGTDGGGRAMKHYLIGARITPLAVAWWCTCGDEIDVVSELRRGWRMHRARGNKGTRS